MLLVLQCKRIKVTCGGYSQKITFRDQTNLTVERATGKTTTTEKKKKSQASNSPSSSSGLVKDEESGNEDVATASFRFVDCSTELNDSAGSSSSPESSSKPSVDSPENSMRQSQSELSSSPPVHEDIRTSVVAASSAYRPNPNLPSPGRVLSNSSLGMISAFEFPEDYTYFEYSAGGSFASISRVLPLAELLQTEPVSPHVYNAAIALAALTLSSSEQYQSGAMTLRRHAFYHSLKAVQGLQKELMEPRGSGQKSNALRADTSFSLFATIMLAANFELQRGSVLSWHSHMRGAASCLNGAHTELLKKPTGMLLIVAFARMALLLRMYNEDYSVTTPEYMSPSLAHWLNRLLRESSRPHDQMLLFVEEVTALEIQKRTHPAQEPTWSIQSADLVRRLELWRSNLPSSELPVDDYSPNGAFLTISSSNYAEAGDTPAPDPVESLIRIPALYFPHSSDPCVSAVNYATFLCTRMRAQTRYSTPSSPKPDSPSGINLDRELPSHSEQTALAICRIAAGNPPTRFSASFTYSYGMLPSVFGAYRWSKNPGLRSWAKHWLSGYRTTREGIWNVSQTLRLIALIDPVHRCNPIPNQTRTQIRIQGQGQGQSQGPGTSQSQSHSQSHSHSQEQPRERTFVALRTVDEPVDPSPELEEGDVERPFKIVLSTRGENEEGSSSNVVMVK